MSAIVGELCVKETDFLRNLNVYVELAKSFHQDGALKVKVLVIDFVPLWDGNTK